MVAMYVFRSTDLPSGARGVFFGSPPSSPQPKAQRGKDFFCSIPRVAESGLLLLLLLLLFGPAYWEHPKS